VCAAPDEIAPPYSAAMTGTLDWETCPIARHTDIVAAANGVRYRVSAWPPGTTGTGCYLADANDVHIGRFPYSPAGLNAAKEACEVHASTARST
jgi:hypothetical protein